MEQKEVATEVLIAGAGPTGLVLALWLVRQGVRVRIVDRAAGPGTESRAMAVQARTLELYRQLDLADEIVAGGLRNPAINLWAKGERRARLSFREAGRELTPFPFVLIFPQDRHERVLVRRLEAAGVRVERGTALLDFKQDAGGVVARLRGPAGETVARAAWLAGCDGAHSAVRHALGTGFEGGTYAHTSTWPTWRWPGRRPMARSTCRWKTATSPACSPTTGAATRA